MKQWSCVELDWLCINVFLLINIYIHIAVKKKTWIPIQEFRIVLCLYLIMIYFYKIWFLNTTLVWSCVTTYNTCLHSWHHGWIFIIFFTKGNDCTFEYYAFIFSFVFLLCHVLFCFVVSLFCLMKSFSNYYRSISLTWRTSATDGAWWDGMKKEYWSYSFC